MWTQILPPAAGRAARLAAAALPESARRNAQRVDDRAFGRAAIAPASAISAISAAYNVRIPRAQEILGVERKVHTAEHLASAMFYLGAPVVRDPAGPPGRRPSRDREGAPLPP